MLRWGSVLACGLLVAACAASSDSDGDQAPTYDELAASCPSFTDAQACETAPQHADGGFQAWCSWVPWVDVELDPDTGACLFGEVQGRCEVTSAGSEGCPGGASLEAAGCMGLDAALVRPNETGREIAAPPGFCEVRNPDIQHCHSQDPAECACLCDPAFPG